VEFIVVSSLKLIDVNAAIDKIMATIVMLILYLIIAPYLSSVPAFID
jgi:hypothetical protein